MIYLDYFLLNLFSRCIEISLHFEPKKCHSTDINLTKNKVEEVFEI